MARKFGCGIIYAIWFCLVGFAIIAALGAVACPPSNEANAKPDCKGKAYYAYEPHCR